ncbi:MAG: hypothetical protein AB1563_07920, partial [Bacillota bacterium]
MGFLRDVLNEIVSLLSFESPAREEEFVLDTQPKLPGLTSDVPQAGAAGSSASGEPARGQAQTRDQGRSESQTQRQRQGQSQSQSQRQGQGQGPNEGPSQQPGPSQGFGGELSAVAGLPEALPRTPYGFVRPRKMSTVKVGAGLTARRPTSSRPGVARHETSDEISPLPPDGKGS